jgi:hypothetical protein
MRVRVGGSVNTELEVSTVELDAYLAAEEEAARLRDAQAIEATLERARQAGAQAASQIPVPHAAATAGAAGAGGEAKEGGDVAEEDGGTYVGLRIVFRDREPLRLRVRQVRMPPPNKAHVQAG